MPLPKVILLTSILGFCASAYSAKPDCAKTQTHVEALICKDAELQDRDAELYAIHKIVIDMDNTLQKPDLETERDAWFRNVRNKCRDTDCLREAYVARLDKLTVVNTTPPKAHYVVNRERFLAQLSAFQSSLSWAGMPGKLSDCKMMINLDETSGSGQDTGYGVICTWNTRAIMICDDTMIGKLTVKFSGVVSSGDSLVDFTEKNCPSGG